MSALYHIGEAFKAVFYAIFGSPSTAAQAPVVPPGDDPTLWFQPHLRALHGPPLAAWLANGTYCTTVLQLDDPLPLWACPPGITPATATAYNDTTRANTTHTTNTTITNTTSTAAAIETITVVDASKQTQRTLIQDHTLAVPYPTTVMETVYIHSTHAAQTATVTVTAIATATATPTPSLARPEPEPTLLVGYLVLGLLIGAIGGLFGSCGIGVRAGMLLYICSWEAEPSSNHRCRYGGALWRGAFTTRVDEPARDVTRLRCGSARRDGCGEDKLRGGAGI